MKVRPSRGSQTPSGHWTRGRRIRKRPPLLVRVVEIVEFVGVNEVVVVTLVLEIEKLHEDGFRVRFWKIPRKVRRLGGLFLMTYSFGEDSFGRARQADLKADCVDLSLLMKLLEIATSSTLRGNSITRKYWPKLYGGLYDLSPPGRTSRRRLGGGCYGLGDRLLF
ncbi:hypothetical protein CORC01_03845 [Colletotrichum orchidophilum]|uniref:Uncharacterized protein n=1 Tax=Colletotrichum orchidophilum TaxID=1209926 RepID=A0A1G4BH89_9PEZI|nr:uncharacterized protein CORC01_03845 [Colletotrichum orchidophilum]OHF00771.1 hypothetical protein CORC01_03845 [Colletotrichum orchidophilum]